MGKTGVYGRILLFGRMIKFSHTIFALPFALTAVVLALRHSPMKGADILWILVAMAGARSAAMGFNRLIDADFDGKNPRTSQREIPSGKLSRASAMAFIALSSAAFIFASAMLGRLCFYLSFPVLAVLLSYSYTKRFTWLAHIYLGFAISLAPAGAWVAITKTMPGSILLLSCALLTYIAGFDILYSCQDAGFDSEETLHSIPVKFGVKKALWIAAAIHLASFGFFLALYFAFDMKLFYLCALVAIGILFIFEHSLVKEDDLSNINMAFFHVNSVISVILFIGVLADELAR